MSPSSKVSDRSEFAGVASLRDLLHTGGISITGLSDLLAKLSNDQHSTGTVRDNLQRAHKENFSAVRKELRVPLEAGGEFAWEVLDVPKALNYFIELSPGLRQLYASAMQRCPVSASRPWRVCIAFDEFSPGKQMQVGSGAAIYTADADFL